MLRSLDGASDKLRKVCNVGSEVNEMAGRVDTSTINIKCVRQCLEGVKADPHRKNELDGGTQLAKTQELCQFRQAFNEEVSVFEDCQDPEVDDRGKNE